MTLDKALTPEAPDSWLAILVPSRGRPHNLDRLNRALTELTVGRWQLWVRLDDDDPTVEDYPKGYGIAYTVGTRIGFAASVNALAAKAAKAGATHFAIFGDDVLPETEGWDDQMIEALDGRLGVVYGSDGLEKLHGPELPTHVVVPVELYQRLGWVVLPTLRHLFADNVWRELGQALGHFVYLPGVKLTHLHPWNKKAPTDETYRGANDPARREEDRQAFEGWRSGAGRLEALRALGLR